MTAWQNFNDAETQTSYDVIPAKTLAKVRMTLKPGGVDNAYLGWTGGYATRNLETGSAYLSAEFVILEGPFAKRKVWSLIGLHSEKGPDWANMGRAFVRAILNSARGIQPQDQSPQAQQARCIQGFADLDGIEFAARIDVEKDQRSGEDRNIIRVVIEPNHKDYPVLMAGGGATPAAATTTGYAAPVQATGAAPVAQAPALSGRPTWAQ
jgi:hypothetical protein